MAEHYVKRVHSQMPTWPTVTLVAPVDLRLRARDDLEAAMQTAHRVLVPFSEFGSRSAAWLRLETS